MFSNYSLQRLFMCQLKCILYAFTTENLIPTSKANYVSLLAAIATI